MPSLTKDCNLAKGYGIAPFSNVSFRGIIIVPATSLPALSGGRTAGKS